MKQPDNAELSDVIDALEQLVQYVRRVGGFMSAEDQLVLQRARDVLEQHGRQC